MPYHCTIDTARRLIVCRAEGVFSDHDVFSTQPIVTADPAFDPSFDQLVDLTDATELKFDFASMSDVATTSVFGPGVRRAIVATTQAQYGIARMFQMLSERNKQIVNIFPDRAAAEAWLARKTSAP